MTHTIDDNDITDYRNPKGCLALIVTMIIVVIAICTIIYNV